MEEYQDEKTDNMEVNVTKTKRNFLGSIVDYAKERQRTRPERQEEAYKQQKTQLERQKDIMGLKNEINIGRERLQQERFKTQKLRPAMPAPSLGGMMMGNPMNPFGSQPNVPKQRHRKQKVKVIYRDRPKKRRKVRYVYR